MKKYLINKIFLVIKLKHISILLLFMFIVLFSSSVYFLFYLSPVPANCTEHKTKTVIVDAGHGGEDGGAVAADNTNEKDYNLSIALKLCELLKLQGYNVIMTRTDDIMTCDDGLATIRERKVSDIINRFNIIENNPQAVFVSIHQNKFSDSSQYGTQVFYSGNNEKSKILADVLQNTIVNSLQPENKRTIKKSGSEIYLLYHAKSPAVLVECGFISNTDDLNKLKTDEYRTQLAISVAEGIFNFYRMGD